MNNYKFISSIELLIFSAFVISSCASEGGARRSYDSRVYMRSYSDMVDIVQKAVRAGEFEIAYSNKTDDPPAMLLEYVEMGSIGNSSVQKRRGKITIEKIGDLKTKVTVKNPDYDTMTSSYNRRDYRRYFFKKIDVLVKKS